jgi:hypothetical protein
MVPMSIPVTRTNVVCAEPILGEKRLLSEFLKTINDDRLKTLMRRALNVGDGTRIRATEPHHDLAHQGKARGRPDNSEIGPVQIDNGKVRAAQVYRVATGRVQNDSVHGDQRALEICANHEHDGNDLCPAGSPRW